jgi:hypothetical protein
MGWPSYIRYAVATGSDNWFGDRYAGDRRGRCHVRVILKECSRHFNTIFISIKNLAYFGIDKEAANLAREMMQDHDQVISPPILHNNNFIIMLYAVLYNSKRSVVVNSPLSGSIKNHWTLTFSQFPNET